MTLNVSAKGSSNSKQDTPVWIRNMRTVLVWALGLTTLSLPGSCLTGSFNLLTFFTIWVGIVSPIIAVIAILYCITWLLTRRTYSYNHAWWSTALLVLTPLSVIAFAYWILAALRVTALDY